MKNLLNSILLLLPLLVGCQSGKKSQKERISAPIPVEVLYVEQKEGAVVDNYVGELVASESVLISARHIGTLDKIHVSQGEVVKKGDVLCEIDSRNTKSSYEISQATLRQAEDGYARVKKVHQSGTVADVKLVEIETAVAKARAMAQASAEALEECSVKAPFSGTISNVYVEQGVDVSLGTALFKLVDISTIEVKIPVPEAEIGKLKIGQEARIDVPALGLKDLKAKISTKGIVASSLSHTYECLLKVVSPLKDMMPGMMCKVYISNPNESASIVIPASAVETGTDSRYVWTVEDGKVFKTEITVGGYSGKGVVVTSGLNVGDAVITQGAAKVSTGMKVKVNNIK